MKKYLLTLLSFLTIQTIVFATNTVEVKPLSISKGGTAKLEIQLENSDEIKAFQFNLVLPDGIIFHDEAVRHCSLYQNTKASH